MNSEKVNNDELKETHTNYLLSLPDHLSLIFSLTGPFLIVLVAAVGIHTSLNTSFHTYETGILLALCFLLMFMWTGGGGGRRGEGGGGEGGGGDLFVHDQGSR